MNSTAFLKMIILVAIDFCLVVITFYYSHLDLHWFAVVHALVFVGFYKINSFTMKNNNFLLYLVGVLPGLGPLVCLFLHILLENRRENDIATLEELEKHLKHRDIAQKEPDVDVDKEVNTLSILDTLLYQSEQQKKQALIDVVSENMDVNTLVLKKALTDDDPEIVHYAASTLNYIEAEFENRIEKLKQQYAQTKDTKVLKKLIQLLGKYIESGLHEGQLLDLYLSQYLQILKEAQRRGINGETRIRLGKVYMKMGELEKAEGIFKELIKTYPQRVDLYLKLMEIYYKTKQYSRVVKIARYLKARENRLSEAQRSVVNFWCRE